MGLVKISVRRYRDAWLKYFGLYLIILGCVQHVVSTSKWKSPDKELLHKLLTDYGSRSIRPVRNSSNIVTVHFRVLIARLIDLDERKQQLTINGWMKQVRP
ncbi:neuronal acetylcholine receptor subunit alpha-2-like [Amphiura filiformis]|uniref:neuronal acetylcholine receptor subunit alpha-2-like n=1 Tax=Amphiura filiformis TaxID=82378 RepID=UPI003B2282A3